MERKELYACQDVDGGGHPALSTTRFVLSDMHWIGGAVPDLTLPFEFRFRHRQPLQQCTLSLRGGTYTVETATPQRAVTPGQVFVAYRGDECLGGGVIAKADTMTFARTDETRLQSASS